MKKINDYIAVDSGTRSNGKEVFNLGVSIQIKNSKEFEKHYFDVLEDFCKKYDFDLPFKVLKARDLNTRVPSFDLKDAHGDLVNQLLSSDSIDAIGVVIGYLKKTTGFSKIKLFNKDIELNGFTGRIWSQYFNITTLWKTHRELMAPSPNVLSDFIQGKITRNWSYVGHNFDLNLIPFGDTTYPAISAADLTSNLLGKILSKQDDAARYDKTTFGIIKSINPDAYIHTNIVSNSEKDEFISEFPYSIEGLQHVPHPIVYIFDEDFRSEEISQFEFFNYAKKWAYDNGGCVTNLDFRRVAPILQKGDIIVSEGPDSKVKKFCRMNKEKSLKVIDIEGVYTLNEKKVN